MGGGGGDEEGGAGLREGSEQVGHFRRVNNVHRESSAREMHMQCARRVCVVCERGAGEWLGAEGHGGSRLAKGTVRECPGKGGAGKQGIGHLRCTNSVHSEREVCVHNASAVCAACAHCMRGMSPLREQRARKRGAPGDGGGVVSGVRAVDGNAQQGMCACAGAYKRCRKAAGARGVGRGACVCACVCRGCVRARCGGTGGV